MHDERSQICELYQTAIKFPEKNSGAYKLPPATFAASAETFSVLSQAKQISAATNGAFDITVAPLVNAWGFGPAGRPTETPAAAEIETLRLRTGWDLIDLDQTAVQVTKTHRDLIADLSAIAKGHGVDRVVETLEAAELTNFMIEIGGEVGARGVNQKNLPWRIGIERPVPGERAVELVVPLVDTSLATSGDYRNYYELDNKRISHTIDPRTGYPITHNIASVSVVHSSCAHADAYATGLLVLGLEGLDLAEDFGRFSYFLIREDNDIFVGRMTSAFKRLLEE